jgi:transcriptional regulator with XRE-family HTH domain
MKGIEKRFGEAVRHWRNQRRLSQEQLAQRAGVHRTYVSDIERGMRNVSLQNIEKLARALEIPIVTLFADPDDKPVQSAMGSEFVKQVRAAAQRTGEWTPEMEVQFQALMERTVESPPPEFRSNPE